MIFTEKANNTIRASITAFRERAIKFHPAPDVTLDQLYEALVKPEHVEKLSEVESLVGNLQNISSIGVPVVASDPGKAALLQITFKGKTLKHLLPMYTKDGFHDRADPELVKAIQDWVERRYYIGYGFAVVSTLITSLSRRLTSKNQMKFYFDGITAILDYHEDTQHIADQMRETKIPGRLPSIPRELRDAGQSATKFLSQMLLLPKSGEPAETNSQIHLQIHNFGWVDSEVFGSTIHVG